MHSIFRNYLKIYYTTLQKKKFKYTIDEYDHFLCFFDRWIRIWHLFFSTTSRFCCTWSRNFCISIENWKKKLSKSGLSLCFRCFLMYFWTRNPKKTSELTYHAHILIFRRFSFLSKNFNGRKRKLTKIKNLNVLSKNKWF